MSTKFFCYNEVQDANITATSENAQFPISNLKETFRSKVFRSLSNADYLVFDFGYPMKIDAVMIVDDPMRGNKLLTCIVKLDNDPAFGSAIEQEMTLDPVNGFSSVSFESIPNMRYMKIEMTSAAGYCEIAKIFAGAKMPLSDDVDFALPFNFSMVNNASLSSNKFGQVFADEINSYIKFSSSLKVLDKNELDGALAILKYSGNTRPIWVLFDGILNNSNMLSGYYRVSTQNPTPNLDSSLYWNMSLEFTEAL